MPLQMQILPLRSRGRGGFWVGLGGHLEDEFAGAGEAHAVAGDFLDGGWIGFELMDFLLQFLIFFVELIDLGLHVAHFGFGTMHGHEAVRAEDVLQNEQTKSERKKVARVAAKKIVCGFWFELLLFPFHPVIHLRASSANLFDLASDSASA